MKWAAGALAAGAALGASGGAQGQGQVVNPVSQFVITNDGQFTGGVVGGVVQGEWSDVTPIAFISPPDNNSGPAIPTSLSDPLRNSLLYAAIAPGVSGGPDIDGLYLMYDYLPRTLQTFLPGEFIADIVFPVDLPAQFSPNNQPREDNLITVQFRGAGGGNTISSVNILVDVDQDGVADFSAEALGMEGAVGFGPSTLSSLDHLLIELEVPLKIPEGFGTPGGPFPGNGINPATGLYDPDPAFWGANITNNAIDPPASAAIFQILPDGSTVINPIGGTVVPEPSSVALLGAGALSLLALRRRKRA